MSAPSGYDHWMTPPGVIRLVRDVCGDIDFDPASNFVAQQYIQADSFGITVQEAERLFSTTPLGEIQGRAVVDGLRTPWYGNVFCNPPYSRGNIDAFVDKAIEELPNVEQMFFLVNSATDTAWYHKLIEYFHLTALWRGRIKFWKIMDGRAYERWEGEKSKQLGRGKVGNSPRYLNTLFYYGPPSHRLKFRSVFKPYASILGK